MTEPIATASAAPADTLLYWEDFHPGEVSEFGAVTMNRDDIVGFARQFDPQPFHVDDAAAGTTLFGGLIASGWHTAAVTMRMMCDAYLLRSAALGSPGLEALRWLQPVRPGDTLHVRMTTLEVRPMQSKPDIGLVRSRWEAINQHGSTVMLMEGHGMFRRRPG